MLVGGSILATPEATDDVQGAKASTSRSEIVCSFIPFIPGKRVLVYRSCLQAEAGFHPGQVASLCIERLTTHTHSYDTNLELPIASCEGFWTVGEREVQILNILHVMGDGRTSFWTHCGACTAPEQVSLLPHL